MLVAASTECYGELPLADAIDRLVDLEFTNLEVALHENDDGGGPGRLPPSQIASNLDQAIDICRNTRRLNVVAYSVEIQAVGDEFYRQFQAICRLAKATKVVTLTVPSAELGTPFNEEVEHLRKLVAIASLEGARVAMRSQIGRLSEDPDTVTVLCDNVKGLGLTFDPSHYICGPHSKKNYEKLMKYVYHVHLRDSSKDQLQVRIGQGEIEYGKLVTLLSKAGYNRALSVHMAPLDGVDHMAEMRKMRLLLESLL